MNGRRLYDEIGGVDERFLQQAAAYRAKRKAPVWRSLLIAAALILVGALVLGTVAMSTGVILLGAWLFGNPEPDAPDAPAQPEAYTIALMEQTLAQREQALRPLGEDAVKLFDGKAQLIWSDEGSDEYYRVYLTDSQLGSLLYLMQKHQVDLDEDSEQPSYQMWISFGDGTVVSPYLKTDAGNAGHGELFDYDPELELSEDLIKLIVYCVET